MNPTLSCQARVPILTLPEIFLLPFFCLNSINSLQKQESTHQYKSFGNPNQKRFNFKAPGRKYFVATSLPMHFDGSKYHSLEESSLWHFVALVQASHHLFFFLFSRNVPKNIPLILTMDSWFLPGHIEDLYNLPCHILRALFFCMDKNQLLLLLLLLLSLL